jgi:hypothetical protein
LWWFRWAAVATLVTGILITGLVENYFQDFMSDTSSQGIGHNVAIAIGMVLGILMAANVWMVIWKNQKVVLANAANVLAGGEANPGAAGAGRKALLASRLHGWRCSLLQWCIRRCDKQQRLDIFHHRVCSNSGLANQCPWSFGRYGSN